MTDPDRFSEHYLFRHLWGVGQLENRVRSAIKDAFRLPLEQQSYPGSVIVRGSGGGNTGLREPGELRDDLRGWLGERRRTKPPSCPEVLGLTKRCKLEARRLLSGALGRERVAELVDIYIKFLGARCDHRGAKTIDLGHGERIRLCPSCGADSFDEETG